MINETNDGIKIFQLWITWEGIRILVNLYDKLHCPKYFQDLVENGSPINITNKGEGFWSINKQINHCLGLIPSFLKPTGAQKKGLTVSKCNCTEPAKQKRQEKKRRMETKTE